MASSPPSSSPGAVAVFREAAALMIAHRRAFAALAAPWCAMEAIRSGADAAGVHPVTSFVLSAVAIWLTAALMRALFVIAVYGPASMPAAPAAVALAADRPVRALGGAIVAIVLIGFVQISLALHMGTGGSVSGKSALMMLAVSGVAVYASLRLAFSLVAIGLGVPSAIKSGWSRARGHMLTLLLISLAVVGVMAALSAGLGVLAAVGAPDDGAGAAGVAMRIAAASAGQAVAVVFANLCWGVAYRNAGPSRGGTPWA